MNIVPDSFFPALPSSMSFFFSSPNRIQFLLPSSLCIRVRTRARNCIHVHARDGTDGPKGSHGCDCRGTNYHGRSSAGSNLLTVASVARGHRRCQRVVPRAPIRRRRGFLRFFALSFFPLLPVFAFNSSRSAVPNHFRPITGVAVAFAP